MRTLWSIVALCIFVIVVGFALLNNAIVTVDFFIAQVTWPLAVLLLLFFIVGGVFGLFVGLCARLWRSKKHRHQHGEV